MTCEVYFKGNVYFYESYDLIFYSKTHLSKHSFNKGKS